MPRQLPSTVDQLVELLYDDLSLRHKVVMANISESDLDSLLYATIVPAPSKKILPNFSRWSE